MSPQPENSAATAERGFGSAQKPEFNIEERRILLHLAHQSIEAAFNNRDILLEAPSPHLAEARGAFTTVYLEGQLRGCVGYVFAVASLYRTVAETARSGGIRGYALLAGKPGRSTTTRGLAQYFVPPARNTGRGSGSRPPWAAGFAARASRSASAPGCRGTSMDTNNIPGTDLPQGRLAVRCVEKGCHD